MQQAETNVPSVSLMAKFILITIVASVGILQRNRLQAGLAVLGIILGVGSVIVMVSIGQGAKSAVQAQLASIGTNVIIIVPGATTVGGVRTGLGGSATLTVADGLDLKKRVALLRDVGWGKREFIQVINGGRNWNVRVYGISPSYLTIRDWSFASGGPFTEADSESGARVAVLGQTVVDSLFEAGEEPVGAIIRIKNVPFRVIGLLAAKGQSAEGIDQDDVIFIPFTTAERRIFGAQFVGLVGALFAATEREEDVRSAVEQAREVLRQRHRLQEDQLDNFTIRTQADLRLVQDEAGETLTLMLFAIASVSLLVGGIGIMNVLLVSVTQRTREIGIRMAVGAKRRHILMQFLVEAITLSLMGGSLGVCFGIVTAHIATVVAGWPTVISGDAVVIALFFSLGVGLFFGLYPASKAARLNPIDALRYE